MLNVKNQRLMICKKSGVKSECDDKNNSRQVHCEEFALNDMALSYVRCLKYIYHRHNILQVIQPMCKKKSESGPNTSTRGFSSSALGYI